MDKSKDKTPYKYISQDGNILIGNDGLTEKVKIEAYKIIEKVKSKLTKQKDANKEKEKGDKENEINTFQEIKDAIVETFKSGPLIWKPNLETTRSVCKDNNEDQLSDLISDFNWNDGGKTRLSFGKYYVEGCSNAGIGGSAHKISTELHDKNDRFEKHSSEYEGRVHLNSKGKCGSDADILGYKACATAQADCHLSAKGKLSHNNSKDLMSKGDVQTCHIIYNKVSAEGEVLAEANVTASAMAGKRSFNADKKISVKAKGKTTFCLADVRTTKRPGSVGGEAKLFDLKAEGETEVNAFGTKASAKAKADCHLTVRGKASYAKLKESKSTDGTHSYHRTYHSANVEGEIEGEANFAASAEAGKHSASIDLNLKGRAKAKADFQLAQLSNEKGQHSVKVFNVDAKGEAELVGSCKINGKTQTIKAKAEGQTQISGVDAKADLNVKKHEDGFSCKGVQAEFGKVRAEGKVSFQLNERTPKMVSAQASFKAASLHCLQLDMRKTENTDDPNMSYKAGLLNVNTLNAKLVGEKTGKKTTVSIDNTLATLNMGNISVTGVDKRESSLTNTSMKVQTSLKANVGNIDITGLGPTGTEFGVDSTPGIDLFNFKAGINRETGLKIPTRKGYFNVDLSIGMPKVNLNTSGGGFNFGIPFFGGGGSGGDVGCKTTNADNTNDDKTKKDRSGFDANHNALGKEYGNETQRSSNIGDYGEAVVNGYGDENGSLSIRGSNNEAFSNNDGKSQVGVRRSDLYTDCSSSNKSAERNEKSDYFLDKYDNDCEDTNHCNSKYDNYADENMLAEDNQLDDNFVRTSYGGGVNSFSNRFEANENSAKTIDGSGRSSGIVNDVYEDVLIDDSGKDNNENIEWCQITDDNDTYTSNYGNFAVYGGEVENSGNGNVSASSVDCNDEFLFDNNGQNSYGFLRSDKGTYLVNTNSMRVLKSNDIYDKVDTEGSVRHRRSYENSRCEESKIQIQDHYQKPIIENLSDPSEFNKYMSLLVAEGVNPNYESTKKHSKHNKQVHASNESSYWNDRNEVEKDLLHRFAPPTDNPGHSSSSESQSQEKPQKRCKKLPQKPFGEKKNIHTIFTMEGNDTKEIIQKGNIACFKDDD